MNSANATTPVIPTTSHSGAATSSGTLIFAASILFLLTLFAGTLPVMLIECLSKRINRRRQSSVNNELTVGSVAPTQPTNKAHRSLSSKLSNIFVKDRIVQFLAQLGGGVLLYTSLIHMLPEIREDYEKYKSSHHGNASTANESLFAVAADVVEEHSEDLPLVDLCSLAGFFAIFLIEELMHTFVMKNHDHHGHGGGEEEAKRANASSTAKNGHQNLTRRLSGVKQAYMDHKRLKEHYHEHVNESGHHYGGYANGNNNSLVVSVESVKSNGGGGGSASMHLVLKPSDSSDPTETAPITSIYQPHRCYDSCNDESHCVNMAIDSNGIVRRCDVENVSNFEAVINEDRTIFARILDALLMILAFSCHAVFDGISIGVQTGSRVWTVLIAILTHKLLIAFILSVQIYERCFQKVVKPTAGGSDQENAALPIQRKPMKRAKPILWMFSTIFALMSPIGIVIVLAFNGNEANADDKPLHLILLAAFSAGTIIYICFLEIIDKSSSRTHISGFVQWLALVTGFGLMHLISTLFHED